MRLQRTSDMMKLLAVRTRSLRLLGARGARSLVSESEEPSVDLLRSSGAQQYVSFYNYTALDKEELPRLRRKVRAVWRNLGVLGRVYLSAEGVNGQLVLPKSNVGVFSESFPELFSRRNMFFGHTFNADHDVKAGDEAVDKLPFDALHVRIRDQIVRDGFTRGTLDLNDSGDALTPDQWHQRLQQRNNTPDDDTLVLDVRNFYEHEVGRFDGATRIMVDTFRDTFDALDEIIDQHAAKHNGEKPSEVMMYCTGGIRCEKVGAYLRQYRGIEKIEKLHGGIVNYAKFVKESGEDSLFKGKNFVFDQRCVGEEVTPFEQVTKDVLGSCFQCGEPCDRHTNCTNEMCGGLILHCEKCRATLLGACSEGCKQEVLKMKDMGLHDRKKYRKEHSQRWKPLVPNALSRHHEHDLQRVLTRGFHSTAVARKEDAGSTNTNKPNVPHDHGYAYNSSSPLPDHDLLEELRQATHREWPKAEQLIDETQGQYLSFLAQSVNAERILEIGCFTGYSAICLASGLGVSGSLITCDIDEGTMSFAQEFFSRCSSAKKITAIKMDGMEFLETVDASSPFDLIFVDANKRQYRSYYEKILERNLLRDSGIAVFDNTLFRGRVAAVANGVGSPKERIARSLVEFNGHVANDARTRQVLLPLWDGLTLIRRA